MKYLYAILVLSALFTVPAAFSETHLSITGTVLDQVSRKPVEKATIHLVGTSQYAETDEKGEFLLSDVDEGFLSLDISHVAYRTLATEVSLTSTSGAKITIWLEPRTIPVDGITVTASRFAEAEFLAPQNVSVTPRVEFVQRNFSTTAEVLREEPGILVQKTTYGHGAPVLRGLIGKHVLLLYDGIRLNRPTFRFGANQYLNTVDLESLDKIEVVHGPSSVMYGSEALGGAVNLVPVSAPIGGDELAVATRLTSRYSSADDGHSHHLELNGRYRGFALALGGSYKKIGDLRAGGDIGRQTPTGWEEANFDGHLYAPLGERSRVRFDYLMVRQQDVPRYDRYVSGDFQQYIYDPQYRDLAALTVESSPALSFVSGIKTGLAYQRDLEGTIEQKVGSSKINNSEDRVTTWGGYMQLSTIIGSRHWLSYGAEYYYDLVRSLRTETTSEGTVDVRSTFPDKSKYYSTGVFLQDEISLRQDLLVTLGARYSYIVMKSPLEDPFGQFDESYDDLTGSISLSYQVRPTVNLISRWSRGFRAPSLNDAVVLKYSSSGVDAPSVRLKPEYSNNFEVGVKSNASGFESSFFVYYDMLDGLIDRVPGMYDGKTFFDENGNGVQDEGEYDIYQRRNVSESRIYGFESHARAILSSRWELRANASWTWGENQTDHEPMSRIPPLMGILGLRYHTTENLWIEIFSRASGAQRRLSQRDIDDTRIGIDGTDSWATLNLRSQMQIGDVALNLTLANITDTTYKEHSSGIHSPGRNLVLGLSYSGM